MTDTILEFVQRNAEWAWLVVLLVAFAESLVVIGLLVPGWILLLGLGSMVGAGVLDFLPVVVAAYLGAVIGEWISFYLGRHYHHPILSLKFVLRHQKLVDVAHNFFEKHGIAGVFVGRFFGPTRAFVPFVAGIAEMSARKFFWVNTLSALLWAPVYLIPGILIGAAVSIDKAEAQMLLFIITIITIYYWWVIQHTRKLFFPLKMPLNSTKRIQLILMWTIAIVLLVIFFRSPYAGLLSHILLATWDRI